MSCMSPRGDGSIWMNYLEFDEPRQGASNGEENVSNEAIKNEYPSKWEDDEKFSPNLLKPEESSHADISGRALGGEANSFNLNNLASDFPHSSKLSSCKSCNFQFETENSKDLLHDRLLVCSQCDRATLKKSDLPEIPAKSPNVACSQCSYVGPKFQLSRHAARCHDSLSRQSCKLCNFQCETESSFQTHIRDSHSDKLFPCPKCFFVTQKKSYLGIHRKLCHQISNLRDFQKVSLTDSPNIKHGDLPLQTDQSQMLECLWRHLDNPPSFVCKLCHSQCENESLFNKHIEAAHPDKLFPCSDAKLVAPKKSDLSKHKKRIRNIHKTSALSKYPNTDTPHINCDENPTRETGQAKQILTCSKCSFATTQKSNISAHFTICHSIDRSFSCKLCDFHCETASFFKKHVADLHSDKLFTCSECNFVTQLKKGLSKHNKKCHSVPNYSGSSSSEKCEQVKDFNNSQNNTSLHIGPSSLETASQSSLEEHTSTTLTASVFPCSVCGSQYSTAGSLEQHTRANCKRRYACPFCPHQYGSKTCIKRHIISHHSKENYFVCPSCDFKTLSIIDLKTHVSSCHQSDLENIHIP